MSTFPDTGGNTALLDLPIQRNKKIIFYVALQFLKVDSNCCIKLCKYIKLIFEKAECNT